MASRDRQGVVAGIEAVRRDLYLLASVIVLIVVLLFFAVRRLRSFIPPELTLDSASIVKIPRPAVSMDGHVATLLQDALMRTRLAYATTPADSPEANRFAASSPPWKMPATNICVPSRSSICRAPEENDIVTALGISRIPIRISAALREGDDGKALHGHETTKRHS